MVKQATDKSAGLAKPEPPTSFIDTRMIPATRLVLAVSALLIVYIDPSEPDRFAAPTYAVLILYIVYSALLLYIFRSRRAVAAAVASWTHWADVFWCTALVALSGGTGSLFFSFYIFAILAGSFRKGFTTGFRLAAASSLLFMVVGYATARDNARFSVNLFLLRPIMLLALGFIMARWGEYELTLRRRLRLLKDLTQLANPRFGVERTIGLLLERLRLFYDADTCTMLLRGQPGTDCVLLRATRSDPESAAVAQKVSTEAGGRLLVMPESYAVWYRRPGKLAWLEPPGYAAYDTASRRPTRDGREEAEAVATLLDAESILTAPFSMRELPGRLILAAKRDAFDRTDVEFLLQAIEHIMPLLDNIRLVDQLASSAAENERRKLARDIHDSVIQPYVGLQLMLDAIGHKMKNPGYEPAADITQLIEICRKEIEDLRSFTRGLKGEGRREEVLITSIRRYAAKITDSTGIAVQVEAGDGLRLNDRLAAEVFQLVAEGLSNIRRHTTATAAKIAVQRQDGYLSLRIQNNGGGGDRGKPFTPRSITERVKALGGAIRIEPQADGGTEVSVNIPL